VKVCRYPLDVLGHQVLKLPLSTQPLSVSLAWRKEGLIDLWALVPEVAPLVSYDFYVVPSDDTMPAELSRHGMHAVGEMFIGTVVTPGHLVQGETDVWHVFLGPPQ
jgi:hypothetical protein